MTPPLKSPRILLLNSYERDNSCVFKLLDELQSLEVLYIREDKSFADAFNEGTADCPSLVIMYEDHSRIHGLYPAENSLLLFLQLFGVCRLNARFNYQVHPSQGEPINLLEFLSKVCSDATESFPLVN
jgi:hypothetical protein